MKSQWPDTVKDKSLDTYVSIGRDILDIHKSY